MAANAPRDAGIGPYEVVKQLVHGDVTDLFLVRHVDLHALVKRLAAVHAADRRLTSLFRTQARRASALEHRNVVHVYDVSEHDGKPYFAMDYIHGQNLHGLLSHLESKHEQLPVEHLVTIATAVASALHHAHTSKGAFVHRAVTPANIVIGFDGTVTLTDFGIEKVASAAGVWTGRAAYMAPEHCLGRAPDRRDDIFSLGVVLFELATVRRLFNGANDFATMKRIVAGGVPAPRTLRADLPETIDSLIVKALAAKPEDRHQAADQVTAALAAFVKDTNLEASTAALAAYMKERFDHQAAPGTSDTIFDGKAVLDGDSSAEGTAVSVAAPDAPIRRARDVELLGVGDTTAVDAAPPGAVRAATQPPRKRELTQIVAPLQVKYPAAPPARSRAPWIVGVLVAAVFAGVVALEWPRAGVDSLGVAPATAHSAPEVAPPAPPSPPPPPVSPSPPQAPPQAPPPAPAPAAAVDEPAPQPVPAPAAAAESSPAPKHKTRPKRGTASSTHRPATKAKPKTESEHYDPNKLFFESK